MDKIGNGNKPLTIHTYKGYDLIKDGSPEVPWNVYKSFVEISFITKQSVILREWVGYGRTIKDCKKIIDDGCCVR